MRKRKPLSRLRLTLWLVELAALLAVIEVFLIPSCTSPKVPESPVLRPPRPVGPPEPAPAIGARVALPEPLRENRDATLPPLDHLAPGSTTAQQTQVRYGERHALPVEIVNSLGMRFRLVPPGSYVMGSPESQPKRWEHETQHVATLARPFYMGVAEVTQEQWRALVGNHSFWFRGQNLPAEEVTWYDCQRFVKALCEREGVPQGIYRLPTEEEWEYACRAGTTTAYYFGDEPTYLHEFAEYRQNNNTSPVSVPNNGRANAWGLHNMLGNVQEWCLNKFRMYETGEPLNPNRKDFRSLRGGHWRSPADQCRAAERGLLYPTSHGNLIGFRVMREAIDFKKGEQWDGE